LETVVWLVPLVEKSGNGGNVLKNVIVQVVESCYLGRLLTLEGLFWECFVRKWWKVCKHSLLINPEQVHKIKHAVASIDKHFGRKRQA